MSTQHIAKNRIVYECNVCNYTTYNKYDYEKHIKTIKHVNKSLATKSSTLATNLSQKSQDHNFICFNCNKHYKDKVITDEYEGLLKLIRLTHKYKGLFKNAILYATGEQNKETKSNYCIEILKVDIYGNKKTNKCASFITENNNVLLDLKKLNNYGTNKI